MDALQETEFAPDQLMAQAITVAEEKMAESPMIAELILQQVLACDPEHITGLRLLGLAKTRNGKHAEAVEVLTLALELMEEPSAAEWCNLGLAYSGLGLAEKAIKAFNNAINIDPNEPVFYNNLAMVYNHQKDYQSAINYVKKAIELRPTAQYWTNLGGVYGELKQLDMADACYAEALKIDNQYPAVYVNLAFSQHLQGNWEKGFAAYEARFWYYDQLKFYMNAFDQKKVWNGVDDLTGKRLIIHCEQGYGDAIQFVRYAKEFKARGAYVILHCNECLEELLSEVDGVDEITTRNIVDQKGPKLPAYDYQICSMSAPFLLQVKKIEGMPYIKKQFTEGYVSKFNSQYGNTFNIGIVWAGSPVHPHDRRRSFSVKHFSELAKINNARLFSLQTSETKREYGSTESIIGSDQQIPGKPNYLGNKEIIDYSDGIENIPMVDLSNQIKTFADAAVILSALDLVICCDTAIAHLAGAMGKKVWVCIPYNPDWRWQLQGESTHWYESMRLFRQEKKEDWNSVFEKIKESLANEIVLSNK